MKEKKVFKTAKLGKIYDPKIVEDKWYAQWMKNGFFHASDASSKESYSIVIPPPNVTGSLHMGHALNNILQDILIRWKRMTGHNTLWMPGTDHAGIATQNVVEKQLIKEDIDRHKIGREEFIDRVWKWKEKSGSQIINQLKKLGASCDWQRERFTMDEGLSRAVREVFASLYREGLIYRGNYIINWCPRCHTALSDLEVEHEEKKGCIYYIKYPVRIPNNGRGKKLLESFLTIATTRPETMLGDTAVAVHPDDERYKDYIGKTVILPVTGREIPIIADRYVHREFGTGALKVTPAHDPNDFEIAKRHNLTGINVMNPDGTMNENAGNYSGKDRFECRKLIVSRLRKAGILVKIEDTVHSVGHCYRCSTVIEPSVSTQWFVKVKPLAKDAIKAVEDGRIKIIPKMWENTYFEWMRNIKDWCISRQIWWGHRVPAWYCDDCGKITVSDAVEMQECSFCHSASIKQDTDVLDTWFSSGLWPFSTLGWPDKTDALKTFYPTSTLITGFDILFFWVARMVMLGLKFMDDIPFKEVYIHALVRDAKGKKMSKSKGNVIDPVEVMEKYGTDAFRFTLAAFAAQGRDIRLSEDRIEGYRNFANKIWNVSRFTLTNLENYNIGTDITIAEYTLADRWITSRLNRTILNIETAFKDYKFNEAANTIYQFIWHEFCDWYIELIKPRLSLSGKQKAVAQHVLATTLEISLRLLHPFMPFITEEIWQLLPHEGESIMIIPFPDYIPALVDEECEKNMNTIISVIAGIRNIRGEMNINPSKKLDVIISVGRQDSKEFIEKEKSYINTLCRIKSLAIGVNVKRPDHSATSVVDGMEIFIPLKDVLNFKEERVRLEKELVKVKKELKAINKKLSNREFTGKAPKEVVTKNEKRQTVLLEKEEKLKSNIRFVS